MTGARIDRHGYAAQIDGSNCARGLVISDVYRVTLSERAKVVLSPAMYGAGHCERAGVSISAGDLELWGDIFQLANGVTTVAAVGVAVIAIFDTGPQEPVSTHRWLAIRRARVAAVQVPVVTVLLARPHKPVSARCIFAGREALVGVIIIAVVALFSFPCINHTVPTFFAHCRLRAKCVILEVKLVYLQFGGIIAARNEHHHNCDFNPTMSVMFVVHRDLSRREKVK
jgi:hypothetical protein